MVNNIHKIHSHENTVEELQYVVQMLLDENRRMMVLLRDTKESLEMAPHLRFMKERIQNELDLHIDFNYKPIG